MAGGGDCLDQQPEPERVVIKLDAGMLRTIDEYRDRFGLADRSEAISDLLMIGLAWSMSESGRPER